MSIVRIKTPDKLSSGIGTLIETADGMPVHGVRKAVVNIEMHKPITADLEVFAAWNGSARARFMVKDPVSGELKQVHRMEFADGSVFDVTPAPQPTSEAE